MLLHENNHLTTLASTLLCCFPSRFRQPCLLSDGIVVALADCRHLRLNARAEGLCTAPLTTSPIMTLHQPLSSSRRSSTSAASMARPTSLMIQTNPDVFSDDYAIDRSPDLSPVDSIQHSSEHLSLPHPHPRNSVPNQTLAPSTRPTSILKRPLQDVSSTIPNRAVSTISYAESSTQRTSSTSSRFSMPRSQSPYVGPTGPSHPYAMYPQVTRASSIASESTIRPMERAFVGHPRPEHPYSMYPQNTVPEEDNPIPLGFPGLGAIYRTRRADDEVADIVGVDGHVEELPPYTRYAENMLPKAVTEQMPTTLHQTFKSQR